MSYSNVSETWGGVPDSFEIIIFIKIPATVVRWGFTDKLGFLGKHGDRSF
jgi:hypothetical protein